jgi:ABC-2 type transport system permease protein
MNILKLIVKDFRAHWLYQLYSMVLLFTLSTIFIYIMLQENGKTDPELVIYFLLVLPTTSMASLLFMKMDELDKTDEVYVSLPVTKTEIVIAKYLSSFLLVLLAMPGHFLGIQSGAYLHDSLGSPQLEIIYNPLLWLIIVAVLLFFKSYAYPLYFRFGLTVGAVIHTIIQFLLLVIFILSFQFFNLQPMIEQLLKWGSDQNGYLLATVLAVALVTLTISSITLSSKFFKTRAT